MITKEIIEALQKADPSGEMEVVVYHEGYAYDLLNGAKKKIVDEGIVHDPEDRKEEPNCVVIETSF